MNKLADAVDEGLHSNQTSNIVLGQRKIVPTQYYPFTQMPLYQK